VLRLVLASTSPYRAALLSRLGVPFEAVAPRVDESERGPVGESIAERAARLARAKAESVHALHPEAHVLASDQIVDLSGEALGKPGDREGAVAQLTRLAGRTHQLHTAVHLVYPNRTRFAHVDTHRLTMRVLLDDAIRRYVAADDPIDCAGSYKIERRGIALFSAIEGTDHTAIVGLPLLKVTEWLARAGFDVP
jgi:septum formation protein